MIVQSDNKFSQVDKKIENLIPIEQKIEYSERTDVSDSLSSCYCCLGPSPFSNGNSESKNAGGWVSDQDGYLIRSGALPEINRVLTRLEADTGVEIAVVVLPSIGAESPRKFATSLFETWNIGKKEKDNGILFLHVIDQRRLEIEMGYGLEGILTDSKNKRILDEVVIPQFRSENFSMGIYLGVLALERGIRNPEISITDLVAPFEFDAQFVDVLDSTIESQEVSNQNPNFLMQFIKSPIQSIIKYSISMSLILLFFLGILFGEFLNLFSHGSKRIYNLCLYLAVDSKLLRNICRNRCFGL